MFSPWPLSHPQPVWTERFYRWFPSSIQNINCCVYQLSPHYIWKLGIWIRILESSHNFINCSISTLGKNIFLDVYGSVNICVTPISFKIALSSALWNSLPLSLNRSLYPSLPQAFSWRVSCPDIPLSHGTVDALICLSRQHLFTFLFLRKHRFDSCFIKHSAWLQAGVLIPAMNC